MNNPKPTKQYAITVEAAGIRPPAGEPGKSIQRVFVGAFGIAFPGCRVRNVSVSDPPARVVTATVETSDPNFPVNAVAAIERCGLFPPDIKVTVVPLDQTGAPS